MLIFLWTQILLIAELCSLTWNVFLFCFVFHGVISCLLSFKIIIINLLLTSPHQFYNCLLRIFRCIGVFHQFSSTSDMSQSESVFFFLAPGIELSYSFTILLGIPFATLLCYIPFFSILYFSLSYSPLYFVSDHLLIGFLIKSAWKMNMLSPCMSENAFILSLYLFDSLGITF